MQPSRPARPKLMSSPPARVRGNHRRDDRRLPPRADAVEARCAPWDARWRSKAAAGRGSRPIARNGAAAAGQGPTGRQDDGGQPDRPRRARQGRPCPVGTRRCPIRRPSGFEGGLGQGEPYRHTQLELGGIRGSPARCRAFDEARRGNRRNQARHPQTAAPTPRRVERRCRAPRLLRATAIAIAAGYQMPIAKRGAASWPTPDPASESIPQLCRRAARPRGRSRNSPRTSPAVGVGERIGALREGRPFADEGRLADGLVGVRIAHRRSQRASSSCSLSSSLRAASGSSARRTRSPARIRSRAGRARPRRNRSPRLRPPHPCRGHARAR